MNKLGGYLLLFLIPIAIVSCKGKSEEVADGKISVYWNEEKQTIDGFGISQAGWAQELYAHTKREEVMNQMFGTDGLRLSILRGEIFPHYWENKYDKDFNLSDDIETPLTDSLFNKKTDDLLRRGQLWLTKNAREKHQVNKLFFSVWSAPAYMKSNGKVSQGELNPKYNQEYADYLVAFYQAYKSAGLEAYAISPSNEPGYAAPWNSSLWTPKKMGEFIVKYLGPTFQKEQVEARIVFGENPFWSAVSAQAAFVSSLHFVDTIIGSYPEITEFSPIASGHGYTLPDSYPAPKDSLKTPIVPFTLAEEKGMPIWLTEISATDALDTTITDGVKWASTFHEFLTVANVNAFIWWGGAMPTGNNESLIVLAPDRSDYSMTKRFYTFGNFTRYIPVGSKRIATEMQNKNDSLLVSAYKNGKEYTVVAVNRSSKNIRTLLQIDGITAEGELKRFLTSENSNWEKTSILPNKNGEYLVEIPENSVATFTGSTK